jgi:methylamine---glutamate N-methyltransferase subunit A
MCGIVGLLMKTNGPAEELGELLTPMLVCMGERGPDSTGLAVFNEPEPPPRKRLNLFSSDAKQDWEQTARALGTEAAADTTIRGQGHHALLITSVKPDTIRARLAEHFPRLRLLSVGRSIDVYKDVGTPAEIAERYRFRELAGSHAVGHTRMATESAVSPAHAHPFTAGEDFCLVHNGSLSNPYSLRRRLERKGVDFETDNDTEAACRFLEWRMREGDSLEAAMQQAFTELDGFYTLLMATHDRLLLVRDAFACKPAVVAETDRYVAIASEFRSLAHLPDIKNARLFEPMPEEIHSWKR